MSRAIRHDDVVATPNLDLLVLRSVDVSGSRNLYEALGLVFVDAQHGRGPKHCSATLAGGLVIEIYPARESDTIDNIRLGFVVNDLATTLDAVVAAGAVKVSVDARRAALVKDLDGRRIELRQADG